MNARLTTIAVAALALVAGGAATTMASAAPGTGKISGTISDPSGYPIAGAQLRLYDSESDDRNLVGTATTDETGRYRFNGIELAGDDEFRFDVNDPSGRHIYGYTTMFPVKKGDTATKNLTMKLGGIIQGKVSTKAGSAPAQPGKHVNVVADTSRSSFDVNASAKGRYRLGGLAAGTYLVSFHESTNAFRAECYHNILMSKGVCKGATTVKVTPGKTVTLTSQVLNHKTT